MDYNKVASDILQGVGGADNVKDVTHCFTRLRFVLNDISKADKGKVSKMEGVIKVVLAGGQFQVVSGTKVDKIYDALLPMVNGESSEKKAGEAAEKNGGGAKIERTKGSVGNLILQTISNIFTPVVPAIAASGLIKGILSFCSRLGWINAQSSTYIILFAVSDVIFYFMPIYLAYTAAKTLKCNRIIAMTVGAMLCYPTIDTLVQDIATKSTIFGLPVVKTAFTIGESTRVFSYTSSVIPIVLGVIVLYFLEKFLKKVIPDMLQIILVPGLSLIIMVPVMLTVIGPIGAYVGYILQWLYSGVMGISPILGGAVVGGLWGVAVIFGAHRALLPIGLNDVALTGFNTLMCYAGSANFAQAGAALGVLLKTKSKSLKQVAGSATISAALVGITEPAIYGCNLRLKRPMVAAIVAGAIGGAIMGAGGAINYGFANNGVLTITTYYGPGVSIGQFVSYLIGICVAFFGAAIFTYVAGFEDDKDSEMEAHV